MKTVTGIVLVWIVAGVALCAEAATYLSPEYVAVAPGGKTMYVTAATAGKLLVFDIAGGKVTAEWPLKCDPSGVAVAADGSVYVTGGGVGGVLLKLGADGKVSNKVETGHTPLAPVVSQDGATVYVLNRFGNNVMAVDAATR